jgi:hypothetical protein
MEIGGHPPDSEHEVWAPVGHGHRRLVVCFDQPPADRQGANELLVLMAETFVDIAVSDAQDPHEESSGHPTGALDDELGGLCQRADARAAVVIDSSTPVAWGASHPELSGTGAVERMLRVAEALERAETFDMQAALEKATGADAQLLERVFADLGAESRHRYVLCARAVRIVRQRLAKAPSLTGSLRQLVRDGDLMLFARGLGGVYALVLAFEDQAFSEPHVEGVVRRTLHHLERLIAALPPIEPPPGRRARVFALRGPRPLR